MKPDGFLLAMAGAIALALTVPQWGAAAGPLHLPQVTAVGIALVFFLHGAQLSPQSMKEGAANWRLHLVVHGTTFLFFPVLGLLLFVTTPGLLAPELRLGLFYLCALPSTISSSVAMTALARGNVAAAIFDATSSGLLGIVLTPLLVGLVASTLTPDLAALPAIGKVATTLLLPLLAGQIARRHIGTMLARHKRWTTYADRTVIVLIVFAAFSESTLAGTWRQFAPETIVSIGLIVAGLLFAGLAVTSGASRGLRFAQADMAAAVFCGSKKSLANGAPIAAVLFGHTPTLSAIMLPVILYHQLQLIVCSTIAKRFAARA